MHDPTPILLPPGARREPSVKIVTFRMDARELQQLDALAERLGVSRSELIRRAIRLLLSKSGVPLEGK